MKQQHFDNQGRLWLQIKLHTKRDNNQESSNMRKPQQKRRDSCCSSEPISLKGCGENHQTAGHFHIFSHCSWVHPKPLQSHRRSEAMSLLGDASVPGKLMGDLCWGIYRGPCCLEGLTLILWWHVLLVWDLMGERQKVKDRSS